MKIPHICREVTGDAVGDSKELITSGPKLVLEAGDILEAGTAGGWWGAPGLPL